MVKHSHHIYLFAPISKSYALILKICINKIACEINAKYSVILKYSGKLYITANTF